MKICHLVRQFHPSVGGLERFVEDLAREQKNLGHECDVLTLDRIFQTGERLPTQSEVSGLRVLRAPAIGGQKFFVPIIPQHALRDYDVLHVHGVDGVFERVARERRARRLLVASSHGLFFHTPWMARLKVLYFHSVTRLCASRYDLMLANSVADQQRLQGITRRVALVPNGVRPLTVRSEGRDLLYLGRLASHKHVDRLIAALAEPALADARLHVVGPDWDVAADQLRRVANDFNVAGRVQFHGALESRALEPVVRRCGVFVSASTYEGFGMSMIEAMSAGLAPVVHANPSFVELVGASRIGAIVDYRDPSAASSAIRSALDSLTPAARNTASDFAARFSWRANAERTLAAYRDAARARRLEGDAARRIPIGPS